MIKFEHTIFALPFAFTGALLAARGLPAWSTIFWIVVAMVGARSAAMGFNRWADRSFDAENPRTSMRALPRGLVTPAQVILFTAVSSALLVFAAYRLNTLSFLLFLHQTVHLSVARVPRACHLPGACRSVDRGHGEDRAPGARARRCSAVLAPRLRRAVRAPGHGL
jgi:hypothetical protein